MKFTAEYLVRITLDINFVHILVRPKETFKLMQFCYKYFQQRHVVFLSEKILYLSDDTTVGLRKLPHFSQAWTKILLSARP